MDRFTQELVVFRLADPRAKRTASIEREPQGRQEGGLSCPVLSANKTDGTLTTAQAPRHKINLREARIEAEVFKRDAAQDHGRSTRAGSSSNGSASSSLATSETPEPRLARRKAINVSRSRHS